MKFHSRLQTQQKEMPIYFSPLVKERIKSLLSLTANFITEVQPSIGYIIALKTIKLAINLIKELPMEIGNCSQLEELISSKLYSIAIKQCCTSCTQKGIRVGIHANGDAGIDMALNALKIAYPSLLYRVKDPITQSVQRFLCFHMFQRTLWTVFYLCELRLLCICLTQKYNDKFLQTEIKLRIILIFTDGIISFVQGMYLDIQISDCSEETNHSFSLIFDFFQDKIGTSLVPISQCADIIGSAYLKKLSDLSFLMINKCKI